MSELWQNPFMSYLYKKRHGRDVKQALPHTVTVCHREHDLQWWRVCKNDSLAVKFCMFNIIRLLDNSEYLSVNFSVFIGDFKMLIYSNCCLSSHASSWLSYDNAVKMKCRKVGLIMQICSLANHCHLQDRSHHISWEVEQTVSKNGLAATHLLHCLSQHV